MDKCIYYVEGKCEKQLINALKELPSKLMPGKVKILNVIKELIPKSEVIAIKSQTKVILVFDTDVKQTIYLKKNIELLNKYCDNVQIIYLPQVLNLEDELVRNTDVKIIKDLTKSISNKNFKTDFINMKTKDCRSMLEHHKLNLKSLWCAKLPKEFTFLINNSGMVKFV